MRLGITRFIFLISFTLLSVQGDLTHLIESPSITNYGDWGNLDRCPSGTFVTGMQLKVERSEGWKDDTGLNGIKFFCSKLGDAVNTQEDFTEVISSSIGSYGVWKNVFRCGDNKRINRKMTAVVGFQLRSERPKGGLDDTGANSLKIVCSDFSDESSAHFEVEGDGTKWGDWTDVQFCRRGYAICGLATQVEHGRGDGHDDTSLNNIRAECCKIKVHSYEDDKISSTVEPENPKFPNPLESARAMHRDILQSIENGHAKNKNSQTVKENEPTIQVQANKHSSDIPSDDQTAASTSVLRQQDSPQQGESNIPDVHHDKLSEELSRLADLDFGKPKITTTIEISNNETATNISTSDAAQPIVPPEIVQYIESDKNDQDSDQDPVQIKVISGSIIKNTTYSDVTHETEFKDTLETRNSIDDESISSGLIRNGVTTIYASIFITILSFFIATAHQLN